MRLPLLLLAAVVVLPACSGLRPVETAPEPEAPDQPAAPAYPVYETFDPAGLDAQPAVAVEVVHDVPPRVMQGRVVVPGGGAPAPRTEPAEPVPVQVEGYRVQVFTSASRDAAEGVRGEAVRWWERAQSQPGAPESLEAVVAYRQPYYKVQLGAFGTRAEADAALALVRRQYPEAFIVPDLVTVMR